MQIERRASLARSMRWRPAAMLLAILAPMAAGLMQMALSRSREFEADQTGAMITGRPLNLASALAKISQGTAQIPMRVNPSAAPLFIVNPLASQARGGRGACLGKLFSTHPPMEERVARLRRMAGASSLQIPTF